ncbi:MAG TPA: L,D-transpeptidase [Polyangiaceae bacterium]|nr:L,D-transpeptidase [Polyangiaceae bacterium]
MNALLRTLRAVAVAVGSALPWLVVCCHHKTPSDAAPGPSASGSAAPAASGALGGVDHGELDTQAPTDSPKIAATAIATTVYKLPDIGSRRLGYLRLGGVVDRDAEPTRGKGCKGQWFHVFPMGYVCTEEATTDLDAPIVRAASRRPDLDKPLPYRYGFVRATSPQYLRIPTHQEQEKSEFKLDEHLTWFEQNRTDVQKVELGSNDIPLDAHGAAPPGLAPKPGFKPSPELSENELFGGQTPNDPIPFWLDGGRKIANVSGYAVPQYAYFADRVRRKTGLSLIGAFDTEDEGVHRRFAATVDMRLVPTSKLKPDSASPFHGLEISDKMPMPFAWVNKTDVTTYKLIKGKDEVRAADAIPRRAVVPLSGNARIKHGERFYQTARDKTVWLRAEDIGVVDKPPTWPDFAEKGEKWIDVSITEQVLVLYEGKKAVFATLVSTGRDKLGDPKETLSTLRGTFRLQSKHIAAAMDSEENSSVSGGSRGHSAKLSANAAETTERLKNSDAKSLNEEDRRRLANIDKGRDPEYGITMRRGSSDFELRDVPWIQYFASGYALHGAYWHDVFGIARSHGCINLAPIDARYVFNWTDPPVPKGWHGINVGADMGEGTGVVVRE